MSRTTRADAASAAVATAKSLADGPKAKAALRRLKAAAAERNLWMPGRHGRRPVPLPEPPPMPSDRQVTLALVDRLGHRAADALAQPAQDDQKPDSESALPHTLVTDRNLAHFLTQAGQSSAAIAERGAPTGPRFATDTYVDQTAANDAVVNCLHQLDHRTTGHQIQLERIEFMMSELLRRLERIEAMVDVTVPSDVAGPSEDAAARSRITT